MMWFAAMLVVAFSFGVLDAALFSASARGDRHSELMTPLGGEPLGVGRRAVQRS